MLEVVRQTARDEVGCIRRIGGVDEPIDRVGIQHRGTGVVDEAEHVRLAYATGKHHVTAGGLGPDERASVQRDVVGIDVDRTTGGDSRVRHRQAGRRLQQQT